MLIAFFVSYVHAFVIPHRFTPAEQFDGVTQYQDKKAKIDLSVSPSKLTFDDLTPKGVDEASKLFNVKAEYGEMFGFKKWKATRHKLFDDPNQGRSWVIEGKYESLQGKVVHFLEIYWATPKQSKEFLFTSEVSPFNLEKYTEAFKP
jgi:hypothetical protein